MPSIGNLYATLGLDTKKLDDGVGRAKKQLKSLGKEFRSASAAGAKMGAAATLAGGALVAALYSRQSKVIDQLAKTADALGLTTEGLQALNHMAELNGVSSNEMAKGLRRMETRLGEAARKGGATKDALLDLGLSVDDLLKQRPDQQLQSLADAIGGVGNQAIKTSIATDLFGRDGIRMLKVLNQVKSDGITPTIAELDRLGVSMTRMDAAKVEAANDAFFRAQQLAEGLKNKFTAALSPAVEAVSNLFIENATESANFGNTAIDAASKVTKAIAFALDAVEGLKRVFKVTGQAFAVIALKIKKDFIGIAEAIVNGPIRQLNKMIGIVNNLPGDFLKLPEVEMTDIGKDLIDSFAVADAAIDEGWADIQATLDKPLPGGQFIKLVKDAEIASEKAALNAVKIRDAVFANTSMPSGSNGLDTEDTSALDALKTKYITEEELERQHLENMAIIGEEFNSSRFETEAQWNSVKEQAERDHWQQMQDIAAGGYDGIAALAHSRWGSVGAETAGAMKSIIGTMAQGSKKAFEISKAWGIADALISTFQGIAAGVKLGWPMGIPAVAWATAQGMAAVSSIKSQTMSGGGSSSAASAPAPASSAPAESSGGGGDGGGASVAFAPIDPGAIYSGRQMIAVLQAEIDSGAKIRMSQ